MGDEGASWVGPGGLQVTAVRLAGAHRVWAEFMGVQGDTALLVTRGGVLVGQGYYGTVEELSDVVDLSELYLR
ncbi:hypothetical protein [Actinomadura algeriensis]|uniref:Uncharacterized protein n=1 Tax=Actinomadura algeriensis TaxID=1679523 RepID=A0ABR9K359_9ACTN|nr:hypothetical protein [Actinomadura algeriensis]MBE1537295.1 hypothetical protein [Actinomadura algeriensis]